jgi:hypothetical protein
VPIYVTAPRPGHVHSATTTDIRRVLATLGPIGTYGVRRIELRQQEVDRGDRWLFGQIRYPGLIRLYEHPAGFSNPDPDSTMREFMLEVLVHEIGHHVHNHRSGKRSGGKLRTVDAEHTAELFVRRHSRINVPSDLGKDC